MKTHTDIPLIVIGLLVIGVILLAIWNGSQVDAAAAQVNASVAASQVPEAALIGGQVAGWLIKTLFGMLALAIATGVIAWAQRWWRERNTKRWKSGPNAQWQGDRSPRQMSEGEMMRMLMLQQLTSGQQRSKQNNQQPADEDDLLSNF